MGQQWMLTRSVRHNRISDYNDDMDTIAIQAKGPIPTIIVTDPSGMQVFLFSLQSPLTGGYKARPNPLVIDANDESLQRYKESLGLIGGNDLSDPNDPRHCIILSLAMNSEGRDPVTIDLSSPGAAAKLKDQPFKIKEGAKFTMSAKFKVQHQLLSGLHYVQIVKRKGIRVSKDQEMLVSQLIPITWYSF